MEVSATARVVEIRDEGPRAKVVVEVLLASSLDLKSIRIRQSRLAGARSTGTRMGRARSMDEAQWPTSLLAAEVVGPSGRAESGMETPGQDSRRLLHRGDLVLDQEAAPIRKGAPQALRYTVRLNRGMDHHLLLAVDAEAANGEMHVAQAYVRVGLDARTQPERLEGLVQFRGRPLR